MRTSLRWQKLFDRLATATQENSFGWNNRRDLQVFQNVASTYQWPWHPSHTWYHLGVCASKFAIQLVPPSLETQTPQARIGCKHHSLHGNEKDHWFLIKLNRERKMSKLHSGWFMLVRPNNFRQPESSDRRGFFSWTPKELEFHWLEVARNILRAVESLPPMNVWEAIKEYGNTGSVEVLQGLD